LFLIAGAPRLAVRGMTLVFRQRLAAATFWTGRKDATRIYNADLNANIGSVGLKKVRELQPMHIASTRRWKGLVASDNLHQADSVEIVFQRRNHVITSTGSLPSISGCGKLADTLLVSRAAFAGVVRRSTRDHRR
jgi:hypothetical protein